MGIYHLKIKTRESLSGHPKNVFLQNKGFKENPGGKGGALVHRRIYEENHFWKVVVFKNDT